MGDLRLAVPSGKEVVTGRDQLRNPDLKPRLDATQAFAVEGVDATTAARVAEECNRVLAQEMSEEAENFYGDRGCAAKEGELNV